MIYTVIKFEFVSSDLSNLKHFEWIAKHQWQNYQQASITRGGSFLLVGHLRGKEEESERVLGLLQPEL